MCIYIIFNYILLLYIICIVIVIVTPAEAMFDFRYPYDLEAPMTCLT